MRKWELQSSCKKAAVPALMLECRGGRAYVRVRKLQGLCKSANLAGLI